MNWIILIGVTLLINYIKKTNIFNWIARRVNANNMPRIKLRTSIFAPQHKFQIDLINLVIMTNFKRQK